MTRLSMTSWVLGTIAAASLCAQAKAGDLSSASSDQSSSSKLNQQIDQAIGSAGASSQDVDSRIKDLETTRANIDGKRPPAVSLSVSGWVSQEVQYNVKQ
jgi:hypothetical protein